MTKASIGAAAALAVTVLFVAAPAASAQSRTDLGRLSCRVGPGVGAIVASRRRMACRFDRIGDTRSDHYTGTITRFGLDIGATTGGVMTWTVFVRRSRGLPPGALAGRYVGVSADASLGLGIGAKALIGGSRRSVVLQPVAFIGQIGANLAIGVAGMSLRYDWSARPPA
jgi:uncharacterized protein DUF992